MAILQRLGQVRRAYPRCAVQVGHRAGHATHPVVCPCREIEAPEGLAHDPLGIGIEDGVPLQVTRQHPRVTGRALCGETLSLPPASIQHPRTHRDRTAVRHLLRRYSPLEEERQEPRQ